jgi:D-hexose-6-phosphate mutarotase
MTKQIDTLNERFAIARQVHFLAGKNGLPKLLIENAQATAEVYLHGAHITAFQPKGQEPVLWMSPLAQFQAGKPIRGGVPVIWPWFGPHATDSSKPQHGFARSAEWQVSTTEALADGSTQVQLQLVDSAATRALWPHAFQLDLTITVGTELKIELTCRNIGDQPFSAGGALHSYFTVGDVAKISIAGLAGREYIDQLDGNQIKQQAGDVKISQEMDRIYVDSTDTCIIHDTVLARQIQVRKAGSRTTVVWNPWKEKAEAMADFSDEGYRNMVCIEAVNAVDDVVQLAPGEAHSLSQIIAVSGTP